jgi:myo-inositol-1(or 4)-monophosphatase
VGCKWTATRKTGSAAIECAFVAAGLLQVSRFASPNIWDIAGGLALIHAVGGAVRSQANGHWLPMLGFEAPPGPDGNPDLRYGRRAVVVGTAEAVDQMCAARD